MFGLSRRTEAEPKGGNYSVEYTFRYVEGHIEVEAWFLGYTEEPRPWMVTITVTDEDAKAGLCSGHTKTYTRYGRTKRHALRRGRKKARECVRSLRKVAMAEMGTIRERL